jgi:hypothetical protein
MTAAANIRLTRVFLNIVTGMIFQGTCRSQNLLNEVLSVFLEEIAESKRWRIISRLAHESGY